MREYIICYDITEPRRLGRIHRTLKKAALPVQYSVFLFCGTPEQLALCLARLEAIMDPDTDDIRAYPLPQRGLRLSLGRAPLPDGVLLANMHPLWQTDASAAAPYAVVDDSEDEDDQDEE